MGGQSGTEAPQGAERTFLPLLSYRRKNRGFLRSKRRRVNISGGGGGGGQTHVPGLEKIQDAQVKTENTGRQEILSLE